MLTHPAMYDLPFIAGSFELEQVRSLLLQLSEVDDSTIAALVGNFREHRPKLGNDETFRISLFHPLDPFKRTPAPPPFASMNSTPAVSKAERIAEMDVSET
ncbi:hypothetical protein [uncultured Jannaschia sp.]|uniref:hypothetical protein n=1 Tax=uncultured Jannaschia sp. TaxID=293347 RepID=UPI002601A5F4|nr:hypothetical protein [uncultured Jannaschia sp.]